MDTSQRTLSTGYVIVGILAVLVLKAPLLSAPSAESLTYSEFKSLAKKGKGGDLVSTSSRSQGCCPSMGSRERCRKRQWSGS
jgi:hypothetical protein